MATITQRLAFLISADAQQAIKAFDKTAASAEKQMGKAGKSIDRLGVQMTRFGAAGLAAAGTLGAGLVNMGRAASDLAETTNKARVIFGNVSKDIERFAESAADGLGLSKRAALDAASTFATFGKAAGLSGQDLAGFSTELVTLSADFASFFNTSPEDAILAIGAALRGEAEPIRRYGVLLNDAVLKQEAMTLGIYSGNGALTSQQKVLAAQAAILKQSSDAQGDFARTSDGLANQQRRLSASIEDLRASLGEAALPVMQQGTSVALGLAKGFVSVNDATGGAISKLVTFGVVGLGAVSAGSLLAGQLIKLRDRFGEVDVETGKFNGKLTTLGKVVAVGSAAIGVASLLYADYAQQKAKAETVTKGLADALKLEGAAQKTAVAGLIENNPALGEGIKTLEKLGVSFRDLSAGTKEAEAQFKRVSEAFRSANIDDLNIDLGKLNSLLGPNVKLTFDQAVVLRETIKQLNASRDALKNQADATQIANDLLKDNVISTDAVAQSYKDFSRVLLDIEWKNVQDQFERLKEKQEELTEANAEAAREAERFKQKVLQQRDALKNDLNSALDAAKQKLREARDAYSSYAQGVSSAVMGTLNLAAAQQSISENAKRIADAQSKVTAAEQKYSDILSQVGADSKSVIDARRELADATAELNTALKEPTDFLAVFRGQETAAKEFAGNVQRLLDLKADRAVIDQLVSAGAQTGNEIAKSILSGADPAQNVAEINTIVANTKKIADDLGKNAAERYFRSGVTLAENLVSGVNSVLKRARIDLKWKGLDRSGKPLKRLNNLTDLFQSQITGFFQTAGIGEDIPQLADGGIVRARRGGTLALLGEGGRDEAVVPLPDRGGLGGTTINVNVSAGMGADGVQIGKQIVDELVAYQRRVGALPIKVSG